MRDLQILSTAKSFPFVKTYKQLKFSICVILALQHVVPFLSTC